MMRKWFRWLELSGNLTFLFSFHEHTESGCFLCSRHMLPSLEVGTKGKTPRDNRQGRHAPRHAQFACLSPMCCAHSTSLPAELPSHEHSNTHLLQQFIHWCHHPLLSHIVTTVWTDMSWSLKCLGGHTYEKKTTSRQLYSVGGMEMDIVQENALKLKRVWFNTMALKTQ